METVIKKGLSSRKKLGFRLNLVLVGVLFFYLITMSYSIFILWHQAKEFKELTNNHFQRAMHAAELSRDVQQITSQALEKMIVQDYNNDYYSGLIKTPEEAVKTIRAKLYATTSEEQAILDKIDKILTPYCQTLAILDNYLLKEQDLVSQQGLTTKLLRNLQNTMSKTQRLDENQQHFANLFLQAINTSMLIQGARSHSELLNYKNTLSATLAKMYYMDNIPSRFQLLLNSLHQVSEQAFAASNAFENQHLATLKALRQTRQYAQQLSADSFDFYLLIKKSTLNASLEHDNLIRHVITNIILFSVAFLLLTAFAYWFIHHYLILRLNRLNTVMIQHVKGENTPIPQQGNDEISLMGKAFSIFVQATEKAKHDFLLAKKEADESNAKLLSLNHSLHTLSHTDELTQIPNRRHFFQHLVKCWKKASLNKKNISLIMIDLDWFKLFNDHYGHQAGDKCLFSVAQIFQQEADLRAGMAARYGGEEFIILLPNSSKSEALDFAHHLVKTVAQANIPHQGSPKGKVTLSLGVASHQPEIGDSLDKLVHLADQTLYYAKHNGRDQVSELILEWNDSTF